MYQATQFRSFIKTFSWRILATMTTISLVYFFTNELEVAATIGGIEIIVKMILYYFHERAWNKISLGKKTS